MRKTMALQTRQQRASRPEWDLREMLGGGGKNVRHRGPALPRATDWKQPWTGGREPGAGYASAVVFRGTTACVRPCIPWAECPPQPAGAFSAPRPTVRSRRCPAAQRRVLAHLHPRPPSSASRPCPTAPAPPVLRLEPLLWSLPRPAASASVLVALNDGLLLLLEASLPLLPRLELTPPRPGPQLLAYASLTPDGHNWTLVNTLGGRSPASWADSATSSMCL